MRFRPGRLALLLFQVLWLNVIVPGHTRGIVTMPGCAEGQCQPAAAVCCQTRHPESKAPAKNDRSACCAICFFAARLTVTPFIDLSPPPLELLGQVASRPLPATTPVQTRATYDGRAPPPIV